MLRSHLYAEVETGGRDIPAIAVHCVHLAARFGERAKGEARRMRELTAILKLCARLNGKGDTRLVFTSREALPAPLRVCTRSRAASRSSVGVTCRRRTRSARPVASYCS